MWQAETGQHVDGVMAVDVVALTQLLAVTGPVTLPDGKVINSSNAEQFLLHDQYNGLSYTGTNAAEARARSSRGRWPRPNSTPSTPSRSTSRRSPTPWPGWWPAATSSSGPPTPPPTPAGSHRGSWKPVGRFDAGGGARSRWRQARCYLQVSCTLQVDAKGGSSTTGTLTVRMVNTTPPGQGYVGGPYPDWARLRRVPGAAGGEPAGSGPASAGHSGQTGVRARRGGARLGAGDAVDMKAGQSETDVIHFDLPASGSTTVLSWARVPGESWHYDGRTFTDTAPHTLSW